MFARARGQAADRIRHDADRVRAQRAGEPDPGPWQHPGAEPLTAEERAEGLRLALELTRDQDGDPVFPPEQVEAAVAAAKSGDPDELRRVYAWQQPMPAPGGGYFLVTRISRWSPGDSLPDGRGVRLLTVGQMLSGPATVAASAVRQFGAPLAREALGETLLRGGVFPVAGVEPA